MTVRELIEDLQHYPPDTLVCRYYGDSCGESWDEDPTPNLADVAILTTFFKSGPRKGQLKERRILGQWAYECHQRGELPEKVQVLVF